MGKFSSLLTTLKKMESAASRGNWPFVAKQSLEIERTIPALAEAELDGLNEQDKLDFNSVREIHSRIVGLVKANQAELAGEIFSLRQSNKASRAYVNQKKVDDK